MFRLDGGWLFLVSPRKSHQKEGDPGSAVGYADCPALLVKPGGCATRACGPQTVLADFTRLACVARRITGGTVRELDRQCMKLRSVLGLLLPSASSSSAGRNGKKGEDCLSPAGASSAAPRCDRAAQSTRRSRATRRARFLLGYFFWARQEEVPRRQGGTRPFRNRPAEKKPSRRMAFLWS